MYRILTSVVAIALALCVSAPAADDKPTEPFNGKDLSGWKLKDEKKNKWEVQPILGVDPEGKKWTATTRATDPKSLVALEGGGCDIFTEAKFGDIKLELEFMVPKGSNSGIYLMGEYEVQILDSFGKADDKLTQGDLGALYSAAAPKKNASKKPGEWQKFAIEFQAPKFEGDKKTANAKFIKVTLNDVVLHENVEMKQHTPGGLTGKEAATGPLMFQGDHGPVAFRNIKITPKK
jgi:3-keto-disaccharide hydrolase